MQESSCSDVRYSSIQARYEDSSGSIPNSSRMGRNFFFFIPRNCRWSDEKWTFDRRRIKWEKNGTKVRFLLLSRTVVEMMKKRRFQWSLKNGSKMGRQHVFSCFKNCRRDYIEVKIRPTAFKMEVKWNRRFIFCHFMITLAETLKERRLDRPEIKRK